MSTLHAPNANVWWCDSYGSGLIGYIGRGNDGLEFARHADYGQQRPGYWRVSITGWVYAAAYAVVDDFGNLVPVAPQ